MSRVLYITDGHNNYGEINIISNISEYNDKYYIDAKSYINIEKYSYLLLNLNNDITRINKLINLFKNLQNIRGLLYESNVFINDNHDVLKGFNIDDNDEYQQFKQSEIKFTKDVKNYYKKELELFNLYFNED